MHLAKTDILEPSGQMQTLSNGEQNKLKQLSVGGEKKGWRVSPKVQIKDRGEGLLKTERATLLI